MAMSQRKVQEMYIENLIERHHLSNVILNEIQRELGISKGRELSDSEVKAFSIRLSEYCDSLSIPPTFKHLPTGEIIRTDSPRFDSGIYDSGSGGSGAYPPQKLDIREWKDESIGQPFDTHEGEIPIVSKVSGYTGAKGGPGGFGYVSSQGSADCPIDTTLKEREGQYGDYAQRAKLCQALKTVMRSSPGWELLSAAHKQSLEMMADKQSRILNGDANKPDSWHDIGGYATLAEKACK